MHNNRKIKLLQLVNGFSIGGAERKLLELIQLIDKDRYDITICSVGMGGPLQQAFEETGYEVYLFEKKHKYDISQVIKLVKLLKDKKIDIVMTTLFYADIIGAIAARIANVKHVLSWNTVSNPPESDEDEIKHRFFYRLCMKFVDKIIPVSDGVKNFLIENRNIDAHKIETIHYGVDLEKYKPTDGKLKKNELGFSDNEVLVGVVARLTVQKGHTYFIDATPEILKKFPKTKFVFIGDGPLRSDLENKIKKLGLSSSFHFLGFRDDVVEILNVLDLFVLPSLYEGLPNVILEAMACALPIVATAVDGTPEAIIDGDCGFLVPSCDPEELAEKINKLLGDKPFAKQLGINAQERIRNHFSNDMQVQKFQQMYEYYYQN